MRLGMWGTTLVLTIVLGACGISNTKYYAQVARANKLEIHLKRKLDRIDFLEAKEKLARTQVRKARHADVERMTRLVAELARVREAMGKKERTLSRCRASRAVVPRSPAISLIHGVIKSHRSAIQSCFISSGLPVKKLRKSRMKVAFTILANGTVGPVTVVSSTRAHATTQACILRTVKRWKFPRPMGAVGLMTHEFRWRKEPRRRRRRRGRRRRRQR